MRDRGRSDSTIYQSGGSYLMMYEVLQENKNAWRVDAYDRTGAPLVAHFEGESAREAANEYATWKQNEDQLVALRAVIYSLATP